ncbi:hypothetical protein QBC46DRAFT_426374 [Diplogelasinospora grovesii]|uniref:C2H2-type domain-containing protein n=1 Tax=Diplogelasinospora grovesii TaxID=303347 RepID=A0AAN6S6R7_9PEZI|nr:hypothetical protein QBC46DRAFT_426374 [Diplogelasinospora grovesii]
MSDFSEPDRTDTAGEQDGAAASRHRSVTAEAARPKETTTAWLGGPTQEPYHPDSNSGNSTNDGVTITEIESLTKRTSELTLKGGFPAAASHHEQTFAVSASIQPPLVVCQAGMTQNPPDRTPRETGTDEAGFGSDGGKKRAAEDEGDGTGGGDRNTPQDNGDGDGDDNNNNNNSNNDDNGGNNKRHKKGTEGQNLSKSKLSCPYRKRNKARFNYRDHEACARLSSKDLPALKSHIREKHRRTKEHPLRCQMCGENFPSLADLQQHSKNRKCKPVDPLQMGLNPEDGITDDINEVLRDRKEEGKIRSWENLWKRLFPNDTEIPSKEYEPYAIAEIHEFRAVVEKAFRSRETYENLEVETNNLINNGAWPPSQRQHLLQFGDRVLSIARESISEHLADLEEHILAGQSSITQPGSPVSARSGGTGTAGRRQPQETSQLVPTLQPSLPARLREPTARAQRAQRQHQQPSKPKPLAAKSPAPLNYPASSQHSPFGTPQIPHPSQGAYSTPQVYLPPSHAPDNVFGGPELGVAPAGFASHNTVWAQQAHTLAAQTATGQLQHPAAAYAGFQQTLPHSRAMPGSEHSDSAVDEQGELRRPSYPRSEQGSHHRNSSAPPAPSYPQHSPQQYIPQDSTGIFQGQHLPVTATTGSHEGVEYWTSMMVPDDYSVSYDQQ